MKKKLLALTLALCLMMGMIPMSAFMEDGEEEVFADQFESFVTEAEGETEAEGLFAVPGTSLPETDGASQDQDENGDGAEESGGVFDGTISDVSDGSAYYALDFAEGYVLVIRDDCPIKLTDGTLDGGVLPAGATLYASARDLDSCELKVHFYTAQGHAAGWVDSHALRVMSDAEISAFLGTARDVADVSFFDEAGTLPLQRIGPAAEAQQATGSVDDSPKTESGKSDEEKAESTNAGDTVADQAEGKPEGENNDAGTGDTVADQAEGKPEGENNDAGTGDTVADQAGGESEDEHNAEKPDDTVTDKTEGQTGVDSVGSDADNTEDNPDEAGENTGEGNTGTETGEGEDDGTAAQSAETEPVYAIALSAQSLELRVGDTANLTVAEAAEDAGEIAWSVEDETVASVDETGAIVALAAGATHVLATAENGGKGICEIVVRSIPQKVHFSAGSLTVGVGEKSGRLRTVYDEENIAYEAAPRYTTSSKKHVTVAADGTIKGVKKGSAVITATYPNGLMAVCKVTVKKAPKKITANPKSITVGIGEKVRYGWKLPGGTASSAVSAKSANSNIVAVEDGCVVGVAYGTAKVTLRTYNGKKDTFTVYVRNAPESVNFSTETITVGVGQKIGLRASVNAGAASRFTFGSEDDAVASVTGSTLVGKSVGETRAVVSTYNGVTNTCSVIVKPAPSYVKLGYSTLGLGVGNSWKLEPDIGDAAGTVTYSSNKKKIATVSAAGVVKGKKKGTAIITIRTYNNKVFKLKVVVRKAPKKVTALPAARSLGIGESFKLGYKLPSGTQSTVTYAAKDPNQAILEIHPKTGVIKGLQEGVADVVIRTFNNKIAVCRVTVKKAPEVIAAEPDYVEMGVGQGVRIRSTLQPDDSCSALTYATSDKAVATVSADGVIAARGRGDATITVRTYLPDVYDEINVKVFPAPTGVTIPETKKTVDINTSFQIVPTISPADSRTVFTFKSSNAKVARVSADGTVEALARGTVKITVFTHNGKKAELALTVYDPFYPEQIKLLEAVPVLNKGEPAYQVKYQVIPETARGSVRWTTAAAGTVKVDNNGLVTPVGFGYSTITATSTKNSSIKMSFVVTVQTDDYTLVIPARKTDTGGISANRAKIKAIKQSALTEISRLQKGGVISASDGNRRRQIVNSIFTNYDFPWMTPKKQLYWKAKNSENGAKDFKPGIVYYGMPYISGSGKWRAYSAAGSIGKKNGFVNTGNGYYKLNKTNYSDRSYCGNDCSGLCNVAIWGMNNSKSYLRTKDIAVNGNYKTISNWGTMRPGDLICKSASHVVMFLYYANAEKTKMMIIENGGSEKATNTVHCSVMNIAPYRSKGYRIRRLKTLG